MFKKIELWLVLLLLLLFLVGTIMFGAVLRSHYIGSNKFVKLQKIAVFISEIPSFTKNFIIGLDTNKPPPQPKNSHLPKFKKFKEFSRNALLILPRYDGDLERSLVEVIDLKDFKVLHTYKHDIFSMNKLVNKNNPYYKYLFFHILWVPGSDT